MPKLSNLFKTALTNLDKTFQHSTLKAFLREPETNLEQHFTQTMLETLLNK
jgi:hypothetical protein